MRNLREKLSETLEFIKKTRKSCYNFTSGGSKPGMSWRNANPVSDGRWRRERNHHVTPTTVDKEGSNPRGGKTSAELPEDITTIIAGEENEPR